MDKRKKEKFNVVVDQTVKLPDKKGNGILKFLAYEDSKGCISKYSLVYINHNICRIDNGRVLGYDNNHGYHHRHFMGQIEDVNYTTYEEIAERFENEWREIHEKAQNNVEIKFVKVKTGTVEDFFSTVKNVMRRADENKSVNPTCATLTFVEPTEMLRFLSEAKIKLIKSIQNHPDTITNLAKVIKRDRSSVNRDILELKKFGLVKIHEEINPGHGKHKIVELTSPHLKLEAII